MSNRRLIFYDDARHYHYYVYEPPMSIREATSTIDAVAGTGVDTFVWGFGVGPTVFHDSKHADVFAAHLEVIADVASWRAYENTMSLINRGCDPLDVMIDRAHEVGMDFIGSLRLTHSSDPADATNAHNWQFKIDHPEWVLKGDDSPNRKNAFNWIYPEVRAERFAIAEETLTRYDVDGLELDLTFDPYYFEADEVAENLHVLTDFIRDLRRTATEMADKRGKSIDIGARVFPTLKANNDAGFDVETWLQEGLLDFVVPNIYSHIPIDPDFPFEVLLDLARVGGCEVYPAMGSVLGANREEYAGLGLLSRRGVGLLESRGGCSLPAMVPVAHRPGAAADPLGDRRPGRAVREAETLLHSSPPRPVRQVRIRGSPTRSARCRSGRDSLHRMPHRYEGLHRRESDIDTEVGRIDLPRRDERQLQWDRTVPRRRDLHDLRLRLLDAGV